jgi:3-phosphoshikimate 1-carboxyvinyltransferase
MINAIEIKPACGPISGRVRPPGSKSITNRALICAALADRESTLRGALASEDTAVMIDSLRRLGVAIQQESAEHLLRVHGSNGKIPAKEADLYIANSGTSVRFLTALLALGQGRFRLDGTPRMRQRPIQDLLDGLSQLSVRAESELKNGCPPIVVHGTGLPGGTARVRGDVSSQFLSGLLMVAPYAARPVDLVVDGPLVSQPYVRLTLAVMRTFGTVVQSEDLAHLAIPRGHYRGQIYEIEPDATAASYFFAAAAITGGQVTVEGLSQESFQGDVEFCGCLAQMGCQVTGNSKSITVTGPAQDKRLRGISVDMNAISDTAQTLAAVALLADGPTTITGVAHIRHKETDRIGNLAIELRRLGASVDELSDGLRIFPGALHGARIETYRDHRMAMSLALVGLRVPGVVILDPSCTEKTYPCFFDDLKTLIEGSS